MNYTELAQDWIAQQYPTIAYGKPVLSDLPTGAIIGTWAVSIPGHMRIITDKSYEVCPGVMPSDLTRSWLKDAFDLPLKRRKEQLNAFHYQLPQLAIPGQYGECAYVDIRHAYLDILHFGYDLEYEAGRYIRYNIQDVPEEIANNKMSYAIAVSMSASQRTNIRVMGHNGVFTNHAYNVYSNPCLYNLACDTLASIASEVQRVCGKHIHYINTDGYICNIKVAQNVIEIIRSWGFDARSKCEGETAVYGSGSWKVGDTRTRRFGLGESNLKSDVPDRDASLWLKGRLTKLNKCAKIT